MLKVLGVERPIVWVEFAHPVGIDALGLGQRWACLDILPFSTGINVDT